MSKSKILRQTLDQINIPTVLINLIQEYISCIFEFISQQQTPACDIHIIDNATYTSYIRGNKRHYELKYNHNDEIRPQNMICKASEHIISYTHQLFLRNARYLLNGSYVNSFELNVYTPECNILYLLRKEYALPKIKIHDVIVRDNLLYFNTVGTTHTDVYTIQLEMMKYLVVDHIVKLPMGMLSVSKSNIYTWNQNNILNVYNMCNKKQYAKNYKLDSIFHVSDKYIYGVKRINYANHMLQIQSLDSVNSIDKSPLPIVDPSLCLNLSETIDDDILIRCGCFNDKYCSLYNSNTQNISHYEIDY
jgi:hypothetical protein